MEPINILYYSLSVAVLVLIAIIACIAYYIVRVLKSAQNLVDKSVETVNSVSDLKNKLNSDFIKSAALGGLGILGRALLDKFNGRKK